MRITETTGDGVRWMGTDGLTELGQTEFAVPIRWTEDDWRTAACKALLIFIGRYIAEQPKRISEGQTMTYGWTTMRFRSSRDEDGPAVAGKLIVQEVANPWSGDAPDYQDGCYGAIVLKRIQDRVMMRHQITGESDAPNRYHEALACTNLYPTLPDSFFMERMRPAATAHARSSGWFVGCQDRAHDHDRPENLLSAHLLHLVEQRRYIYPYLSLPIGSAIAFEPDKVIVFAPGAEHGHAEMANPFTDLDDQA